MARERIGRRQFLKRGVLSAGAGGVLRAPAVLGAVRGAPSPNERIRFGLIGCGGRGTGVMNWFRGHPRVEVVAVCDVHLGHARRAARAAGVAGTDVYMDFRNIVERKDVDAFIIGTPDHWHTLTALAAVRAGKDVYCEKPLTLFIDEGRLLVQAVRETGRVFQVGSQQRSDGRFRHAVELVRNGHVGRLTEVETHIGRGPKGGKAEDEWPPPGLNWDLYLGPAPNRRYNRYRFGGNFRWFWDYSGGKMTDWGAHHNDIAQWGIGAERSGPIAFEGEGRYPDPGGYETCTTFRAVATYGPRFGRVRLICQSDGENGVIFRGTKGEIFVNRRRIGSKPPEIVEHEIGPSETRVYRSDNHRDNFIACMESRERPVADVEIGHRSVTVCHLMNIAIRTGRTIRWDPDREEILGDAKIRAWQRRPMREPWKLV